MSDKYVTEQSTTAAEQNRLEAKKKSQDSLIKCDWYDTQKLLLHKLDDKLKEKEKRTCPLYRLGPLVFLEGMLTANQCNKIPRLHLKHLLLISNYSTKLQHSLSDHMRNHALKIMQTSKS